MRLCGRSLETARALALVQAALSGVLLYAGARRLPLGRWSSFFGALLPLFLPLIGVLAAATVPELPTAALIAYAVLATAGASPSTSLTSGAAILAATLCRYEAWPVAFALCGWAAWRSTRSSTGISTPPIRWTRKWPTPVIWPPRSTAWATRFTTTT